MLNNVVYFAVHAADLERAIAFYRGVFGWQFSPWGPPDFYLIRTGTDAAPGIRGALQKRHDPVQGEGMIGFECSIAVEDIDSTGAAVAEHGGTVVVPKMTIPTVGQLIKFKDPDGNVACAVQYEEGAI